MSIPSAYFPHTAFAEDQPFSHLILTTHVLSRGFQTGASFGPLFGTIRHVYARRSRPPLLAIVRSAGVGGAYGVAFMAVGLGVRMWGRQKIEWQDRSWRLMENKGQIEVDTFSAEGAIAGAGLAAWTYGRHAGWRMLLGGAGAGGLLGVVGYMGWRYGVKGGKWEDAAVAVAEELNPVIPVEGGKTEVEK